jgi:hypothetical protein
MTAGIDSTNNPVSIIPVADPIERRREWTGKQFKTPVGIGHESKKGYGPARRRWDQSICIPCDQEFTSHYRVCPYCGLSLSFRSEAE